MNTLCKVPANRMGYANFTLPQLKIMQEVITMIVFVGFSLLLRGPLKMDYFYAGLCLLGAIYFIFRPA